MSAISPRHWWKGVTAMANTAAHSGIRHKKPTGATPNGPAFIEQVRSRAYELYEFRGKQDGHDLEDWLLAEKQVIHHAGERKRH
jgi:hypothetical protein